MNAVFGPKRLFELGSGRKQWPVRNRSKLTLIKMKAIFSIEQKLKILIEDEISFGISSLLVRRLCIAFTRRPAGSEILS